MKTTSNSLPQTLRQRIVRILIVVVVSFLNNVGSNIVSAKLTKDLDWQEVGKIFVIWNPYIENIPKTICKQPQPTLSIDPENSTAPPSNELEVPE